jgi:hypothetical protein
MFEQKPHQGKTRIPCLWMRATGLNLKTESRHHLKR